MKHFELRGPASLQAILIVVSLFVSMPARSQATRSDSSRLARDVAAVGSAPAGSITGVVVDAETGETLLGANVVVDGTVTGSTTDLDGRYEIAGLAPGSYDLLFRFVGYRTLTVRGVAVAGGAATELDAALASETLGLDEVIVEARALLNTEAALLRARQKATALSDAIGGEAMSRAGLGDAASALARVTGASIAEGKFVFVRGLGDRYSTAQLNGARLPSPDPDRNAVPLDLFPSNLLDNVVTLKTFTPDRPGNFSGGLVDISTRAFPDRLTLDLSTSTSLNARAHLGDGFILAPDQDLNWLGFAGNAGGLPSVLSGRALQIPDEISARSDAELARLLHEQSNALATGMAPASAAAPINQEHTLSFGNRTSLLGRQIGYVGSLTYGRSATFREGRTGRLSVTEGSAVLTPDLRVRDVEGAVERSLGGLLNVSFRPWRAHEVGFNTFYSRSGESVARYQEGWYPGASSANDTTTFLQNRVVGYTERTLLSKQLRGEHRLGPREAVIKWSASLASTEQDEPDLRFFANTVNLQASGDTLYGAIGSGLQAPSRYFRNLAETSRDAQIDVELPLSAWNARTGLLKLGGAFTDVDRSFRERLFQVYTNSGNAVRYGRTYNDLRDAEAYFSSLAMGIVDVDTLVDGRPRYQFVNYLREASKPKNNYDGSQRIVAGYAMVELPVGRRLQAVGGLRVESTRMNVVSQDPSQQIGRISNVDLLPSINLIYRLRENMNARAALTRTLARPTFREIAPFESFDFILGNFFIGNPELERTLITNADLRWEWFSGHGEVVAVSGFYKLLDDPIERAIVGGTNGQRKFVNVEQATVAGAELELRTNLGLFGRLVRKVSVGANASFVWSRIHLSENELRIRRALDPDAADVRELQGQSPYILNLDLRYDDPASRTAIGLYYNVFGRRLAQVSLGATPDVYERPRPILDLTVSQGLFDRIRLKFSAKNLLDSAYRETYRYRGQDFTYFEYELGRTYSVGVSYAL